MAVMTSETSEGVAFEQKTQPVPSSDKMALDLDINGTSNRHETNIDLSPTDPSHSLNQNLATPSSLSPADELVPRDAEIKATSLNAEAFSSNNILATSALNPVAAHHNNISVEAHVTQESSGLTAEGESSFLDSQDTSAPTAPTPLSASPSAQPLQTSSDLLASAESAVEAAVEDHTGTSTIPPVIDAPESDLRDTSMPPNALQTEEPILDTDLPLRPVDELLDAQDNSAPLETNATAENTNHTHNMSSPGADNAHPFPDDSFEMANSTPTQSNNIEDLNDTEMTDVPPSSTDRKISRGREDDDEEERSAKRTKTEDIEMEGMDGTPRPEAAVQNGDAQSSKAEDIPLTQHQIREISKVLKSAVRTQAGKNFRAPAVELWPSFAEPYLAKVPHPIDLGNIDKKIKENAYLTYQNFAADVNLLADNAVLFNGPDHVITKAAQSVRDSILDKTRSIPREVAQPPKPQKKGVAKRSTPSAESASKSASTARRGSTTRPTGATVKNETFALNPATGLPPPRRNSNMADDGGRPKREIHPPKNKDLPYSVGRPKGRKNATELKFCDLVLTELKKNKYAQFNFAFLEPVDPVAMNIPDYFKLIKHPMDLQTITNKLADGHYIKAKDFEADVRLMLSNCFKFNPSPHPVHQMGKDMENLFNQQWQRKSQYISDHTPAALSPSSTVDSDDESDEEVVPEPAAARGPSAFAQRLIVEQSKLIELMSSQASQDEISMQQDIVAMVQSKVDTENQQAVAPKKPNKKAKSATTSKPAKKNSAPAKKSSTSTGNKKSGGRPKYIGTTEREVVSAGVGLLPDETSGRVMDLIKGDIPDVKTDGDGSLELEIDALSDATLWELYDMVVKHLPEVANTIRKQKDEQRVKSRTSSQPKPKKKNKPMSKGEQERKIQHLKNSIETFERHGSGSQEPVMPTVEQQDESSGDESSDSEEE